MSATLVHRGPDSDGSFADGPVALAARRLAIIDLETGDQPIANEDGTIHVVQNGDLYNYRELRAELERQGHAFRTQGDTEVLVHLYEQHGLDFARRLRGMFAAALWDSHRQRLVLPRERRQAGVRVRAPRPPARRDRPRRAGGLPRLQLDPGAADDLRRGAKAPARVPAHLGERRTPARALRPPRASARRQATRRRRGRAARRAPCPPARLGPRTPRFRR